MRALCATKGLALKLTILYIILAVICMLLAVTNVPFDGCRVVNKSGVEICVDYSSTPIGVYISYFLSILFSFIALRRLMSGVKLEQPNKYNSKDLSNFDS
jgi:hypothetical protein